jgi:hypothetical protein
MINHHLRNITKPGTTPLVYISTKESTATKADSKLGIIRQNHQKNLKIYQTKQNKMPFQNLG